MSNHFSFSSFPSMALLISLFALASLLASPTLSTSNDNTLETTGFKATLSHVDHGKSLTKTELLLRSIQRGEMRQAVTAQPPLQSRSRSPSNNIIASLSGAGNHGEYSMNLTIDNPPINHTVYIDTDTDLIWIKQCDKTSTSLSTLPCSDNLCKQVGSCSKKPACHYKYQYSATDSVQVNLATANFTFGKNVHKLAFSCGVPINLNGIVGLGRGPLSLISQMKAINFSHCLPSYDYPEKTGIILVGSPIQNHPKMKITSSIITNKFFASKYYINVTGICVGNVNLTIDADSFSINKIDGTWGMVIDIGSTVTYLEPSIFEKVHYQVSNQINRPTTSDDKTKLPVCFATPKSTEAFTYPIITFYLGGPGGSSSNLTFSIGNTYREYTVRGKSITCLAMKAASHSEHKMSSLGNIMLQDTLVVYDLVKETVAFLPNYKCDKM